ncbi:hypothetical protein L7F22_026167 [Adiantum nelumboides]|nr:hypothetical protein [Adiantum nelumboides]
MADHGFVVLCHSSDVWHNKLEEATVQQRLVVVAFKANWCGPCRMMAPVFSELSRKFPQTIFLKIDVDEMQDISAQWNVQAMPTFIIIKDSKELDRVVGANKEELEKRLTFHVQNFSKS